MADQLDLFGEPIAQTRSEPTGFQHWSGVLAEGWPARLAQRLADLPLVPYEFQGFVGKRRVLSFGYKWNQISHQIDRTIPLPDFLLDVREQVAAAAGLPPDKFVQALVNEYQTGAGIGWHRDRLAWGEILGLSLLEPCTLRLRHKVGARWNRASARLESGSAYLLSGEVRHNWEHSIHPMQHLRYSVTFRTLANPATDR